MAARLIVNLNGTPALVGLSPGNVHRDDQVEVRTFRRSGACVVLAPDSIPPACGLKESATPVTRGAGEDVDLTVVAERTRLGLI